MSEKKKNSQILKKKFSFFLDLKKVFDTLDHEILLQNLKKMGLEVIANYWLHSYPQKRSQRVVANGVSSHWQIIRDGVPKDSILGPLLFVISIWGRMNWRKQIIITKKILCKVLKKLKKTSNETEKMDKVNNTVKQVLIQLVHQTRDL